MFLTTQDGVVLVDAPLTIGHNNAFTVFEFAVHEDGGVLGPFGIHP
jgi:hypothetical protein